MDYSNKYCNDLDCAINHNNHSLRLAIKNNRLAEVVDLIKRGADPLAKDDSGSSAVHIAAQSKRFDTLAYILANLHDIQSVDIRDSTGMTPLMYSVKTADTLNNCRMLINFGASVNCLDDRGNTALHWAFACNNKIGIKEILKHNPKMMLISDLLEQASWPPCQQRKKLRKAQKKALHAKKGLKIWGEYDPSLIILSIGLLLLLMTDLANWSVIVKFFCIMFIITFVIWFLNCLVDKRHVPISFYIIINLYACSTMVFPIGFLLGFSKTLLFNVFASMAYYYYYKSCVSNPGLCPNSLEERLLTVREHLETDFFAKRGNRLCTTCIAYRHKDSGHCDECNGCVYQRDKHYIWLNNCVGYKNVKYFNRFVVSYCFLCFLYVYYCVSYLMRGSFLYSTCNVGLLVIVLVLAFSAGLYNMFLFIQKRLLTTVSS